MSFVRSGYVYEIGAIHFGGGNGDYWSLTISPMMTTKAAFLDYSLEIAAPATKHLRINGFWVGDLIMRMNSQNKKMKKQLEKAVKKWGMRIKMKEFTPVKLTKIEN